MGRKGETEGKAWSCGDKGGIAGFSTGGEGVCSGKDLSEGTGEDRWVSFLSGIGQRGLKA